MEAAARPGGGVTSITDALPSTPAASTPHHILNEGARRLLALGRADLAEALVAQALAANEDNADTHSVAAAVGDAQGDWARSLAHLRRAHVLMPNAPQVRLNLAMALLRQGEYREGLALYEARVDKPTWTAFATAQSRAASGQLLLRPGDRVEGRRILVLAEQGMGDAIMAARFVPLLAQQGARVALACSPALRPFFARVAGIETLLSPPADQPEPKVNLAALAFDAWVPLLSLPRWFGTEAANIPGEPYWTPDTTRVAFWRDAFGVAGRAGVAKVGLVFQANPAAANYAERSLQIEELRPLLALDLDFVNLQHGPAGRALAAAAPGIIDPFPAEAPLDEFAAALAATDLLVTVDTMAAHLAGAMGHPVWIAVPYSAQWFWGLDRSTTPWYPSARIVRQTEPREWADAIDELASRLKQTFGAGLRAGVPAASPTPVRRARDREAAQALAQTAGALVLARRADLARLLAELSLRTDPDGSDGHDAMADVLEAAGEWEAALAHRKSAAASALPAHRLKLALSQLMRGEFAEGFVNYEARLDVPLWAEQALPLRASLGAVAERRLRPGDPLRGRRIVVFTEQGLGDTILGARFLPLLAERGATITLICRAPLRPFFARMQCCADILSPPDDAPHAKINLAKLAADAFSPLLSLPHTLGIGRDGAVPDAPYLTADAQQVAAWRARYAQVGRAGARKIGLVWQANPSNPVLTNRSMQIEDLRPLAALTDIDFVNLQHGPAGRDLVRQWPEVIDTSREEMSLDAFAAALAATDLLISVDTMAAHLAGALGHPFWAALPSVPGWWWGLRDLCPWYPAAHLFRQAVHDDWSSVIAAMAMKLAEV
jgi:ADP-heptose:LPS heptosyltransferase/Tfp pilus assembly protein PilF